MDEIKAEDIVVRDEEEVYWENVLKSCTRALDSLEHTYKSEKKFQTAVMDMAAGKLQKRRDELSS